MEDKTNASPADATAGTTGNTGASDTVDQGKQSDVNFEIAFKEKNAKLKEANSELSEAKAKLAEYENSLKKGEEEKLAEQGKWKDLFDQRDKELTELKSKVSDYEAKDEFVKKYVSDQLESFKKEVGDEKFKLANETFEFESMSPFQILNKMDKVKAIFGTKANVGGSDMQKGSATSELTRYDELMKKSKEKGLTVPEGNELIKLGRQLKSK